MRLDYDPEYAVAGLALLVALCSFPYLRRLRIINRAKNPQQDGLTYEDEDGAANEDSIARFSNKAQFIAIFVIASLAIALSCAAAIFTAVKNDIGGPYSAAIPILGSWCLLCAWVSFHSRKSSLLKLTGLGTSVFAIFGRVARS